MVRILFFGIVIYLLLGLRIVKPEEWLVVTRSGKYSGFRRQGLHWVIPFVDQTVRVDLTQVTETWANTPEEILETQVQQWLSRQEPS